MRSARLLFWSTFLGGAGALAGLAELGLAPDTPEVVPVAPRPAAEPAVTAGSPAPILRKDADAAPAPVPAASASTLFLAQSWERKPPPAPPPPPPAPAPPPAAPPLPFRFMGRLDDGATVKVFLRNGERVYAAAVGDVLDGQYKVARIDPRELTLVYLPLAQPQTLPLGSPS